VTFRDFVLKGHGFSRAEQRQQGLGALAPEWKHRPLGGESALLSIFGGRTGLQAGDSGAMTKGFSPGCTKMGGQEKS